MLDDQDIASTLKRCLNNGAKADWERFIEQIQPLVASAVLRILTGLSGFRRELADDLIQDVFLKLCADHFRVLRNFRGEGSVALRAYLKAIAGSITMDHFRSAGSKTAVNLDDVGNWLGSRDRTLERLEREKLLEHVEKCLDGADSRNHSIFWLYHRQGMRPKEIAALPGIGLGMSGVETAIYKLTTQVRDCLRRAGVLEPTVFREGGRA